MLTNKEINKITNYLQDCGLKYEPLQDELLDHICTAIEVKMENGQNFENASREVLKRFDQREILKTQRQTILLTNQKKQLMTKISLMALLSMLLTFTVIWEANLEPPSGSPIDAAVKVTSGFGKRIHPVYKKMKMHLGVDFKVPMNTPIHATSNGVIVEASHNKGYGNYVLIKHDKEYSTRYAHLSVLKVKANDEVEKGQVIGLSGNSGMSTVPHLHYEVIKNGKRVDPKHYLNP